MPVYLLDFWWHFLVRFTQKLAQNLTQNFSTKRYGSCVLFDVTFCSKMSYIISPNLLLHQWISYSKSYHSFWLDHGCYFCFAPIFGIWSLFTRTVRTKVFKIIIHIKFYTWIVLFKSCGPCFEHDNCMDYGKYLLILGFLVPLAIMIISGYVIITKLREVST